jgi:hypothetical protein
MIHSLVDAGAVGFLVVQDEVLGDGHHIGLNPVDQRCHQRASEHGVLPRQVLERPACARKRVYPYSHGEQGMRRTAGPVCTFSNSEYFCNLRPLFSVRTGETVARAP